MYVTWTRMASRSKSFPFIDETSMIQTTKFVGDANGQLQAINTVRVEWVKDNGRTIPRNVTGSEQVFPAQLVLLAMGFTGPQQEGLVEQLGVELDDRGNVARDASYKTSVDGVFVAGDAGRGQSLIVWAIAEGRSAAAAVDAYLTGGTNLPAPIPPTERPVTA